MDLERMTFELSGRECRTWADADPRFLLVHTLGRHERPGIDGMVEAIRESGIPSVSAAFQVFDWSLDLMPWNDPAVDRDPRSGMQAVETLRFVTEELLPHLRDRFGPLPVILGGYSLGGLFALWAASRTDGFAAVAAASPSLWIRDWLPFARENPIHAEAVYLSLGDREEHVKNRAIAGVGNAVREEYDLLLRQLGRDRCTLRWNEGGHFQDGERRLSDAFKWCLTTLSNTL